MNTPDPRLHPYREDLADAALEGQVSARRFVVGERRQASVPSLNIHLRPAADARQVTQALMGELVDVFEVRNGWAWIKLVRDGYVGYAEEWALSKTPVAPTHRVQVLATLHYPKPDLKAQPVKQLGLNCTVAVTRIEHGYAALATGGYVFAAHQCAIDDHAADFVGVAEMFLHVPYLWGGKGPAGLDCSGLVQIALEAAGQRSLRDADMQEDTLGNPLLVNDLSSLRRGDLVFWDGHVGIMADAGTLLHANGQHMMVVKEPLTEAIARIAATGKPVTSIKRFQ
jgi:cell wall-associated NlpC family hydrolase